MLKQAELSPSVMTATQARERMGLTAEDAARRLRISPRYLRAIERNGNAPFSLSERLAKLYGCPMHTFLYRMKGNS